MINHICFSICSTYILISPAVEQMLYGRYLFGLQTGEWGPYEALTPTEKIVVWLRRLWGGALWVSKRLFGVVYFGLGDGGGVFDNRFVFSAPMAYMYGFCHRWVL